MSETARVGVLYRGKGRIQSLRMVHREELGEELAGLHSLDAVEEWMVGIAKSGEGREGREDQEEDRSYLDYFYRCLDEGAEFYYLYECGVGWKVGCTMKDVPVRGRLVGLDDWLHWKVLEGV